MLKKSSFVLLMAVLLATGACTAQEQVRAPRNVVMFIADGCGPASFTLARDFMREIRGEDALALDPIMVGSVRTFASNSRVTDSAASATAYACGVKTYNGAIAVDTLRRPVATLLEAAEAQGMATGLVATSRVTHATPAAYSAHVPNRGMEGEIASQQITQGIDVILGGGWEYFLPEDADGRRGDGRNLLEEAQASGYHVVQDRDGFDAASAMPLLGLFTASHLSYEIDRNPDKEPSLAEMTTKALDLLQGAEGGFFLMIEGSRIDHAGHANDAAAHLHDIIAYDAAVAAALAFAEADGETLVVATSDHETGGLSLGRSINGVGIYDWKPEVLARVQHSHDYIGAMLQSGVPWEDVMKDVMGIDDLDDEDTAAIAEAYAARDGQGIFRGFTEAVAERAILGWTSNGHTAVDVNLYAYGPGAEHFRGNRDNTYIGRAIADLLGLDLDALTEKLRQN